MNDATKFADALRQLIEVIGWTRFLILSGLGILTVLIPAILRNRRTDAAIREVVAAKNETIERIAQQNRELRLEVLVKNGMTLSDAYRIVYDKAFDAGTQAPKGQPPETARRAKEERK